MSDSQLRPGLTHTAILKIGESLVVPNVNPAFTSFADMPHVFATAFLVAFVESTCVEALKPLLPHGTQTVGTRVELSHDAATPIGLTATAIVELTEFDGRRLRFAVECRDEHDVISTGHHDRFIIDRAKFDARTAAKAGPAS
ncbi:MAG: thioesterase family protein [Stackebrandtia sp.]